MNSKLCFFIILTLLAICKTEEEEEEEDMDYPSEDVSQKVSKLRVEGAEYLQKVMSKCHSTDQLQNDRTQIQALEVPEMSDLFYTQRMHDMEHEYLNHVTPIYNISGPTPVPDIEAEIVPEAAPPISLSKEELLALYEAALVKASQLQVGSKPSAEIESLNDNTPVKPALQGQMGSPVSGYYYYYFPIKSFLKADPKPTEASKSTPAPPQQLHATITMMDSPSNKSVEPLFMAISGFIGMALMFFFSVLFVPKFSKIRSKNAQFKDEPDDLATYAQIILEAMAGKDCSERFACEITRIFRGLKSNNKPLRILEILLPPNIAQKISQIRKAAGKRGRCSYIPCKMKKPKPPQNQKVKPPPQKQKPWKNKKETPHDLWMKHFEKQKMPPKKQKQETGWNRKPPTKRT